ncbi:MULTISPECIES: hypothetical protein [Pseudoalteromonas]|uniref:hypothetical protein n=1 Tax=Pseudoalteromonas TaxID=53246 RepID=UPI00092A64BB|nr:MULTISPECIES: hypothetical protein [Pseudoalteromonas]WFO20961.1 hypothetical protein ATS73_016400 [Pseudoalteromonas sp. H100]SIO21714.1 hypothetical protein SAMN05878071_3301 [Pseudoalteromonas marina]
MTTTIFRKNKKMAQMASDSRVSWIDTGSNIPNKWFDSDDYLKTITIDDVMYGFAGTNVMFKMFLQYYESRDTSIQLLDTLVLFAKENRVQFFIIRYEIDELRLFCYSPQNPDSSVPCEIFRISKDPIIDKDYYAIGSGKYSKQYKKNRRNSSAQIPIRSIINANLSGLKKGDMVELTNKVLSNKLTPEESNKVFWACKNKGGDLFTGGKINMSKNATRTVLAKQVQIMDEMDKSAKAQGAVCASPVDACLEIQQLNQLGQYSVSPYKVTVTDKETDLLARMKSTFIAST